MTKELQERQERSMSAAFSATVGRLITESTSHDLRMTEQQKRLVQGYFIGIDQALREAEKKRNPNKNALPYIWQNVDMERLAITVRDRMKLGLDMSIPNHVHAIPYQGSEKIAVGLMQGYVGIETVALKYALDPPISVVKELVYSTDVFEELRKSDGRDVESYVFEVKNPFNRGEVIGGFGYYIYDDPRKNRLITMPISDIMKRKPKYASDNFWGGWTKEMQYKTLVRFLFNERNLPRDPDKIDDAYNRQLVQEMELAKALAAEEIEEATHEAKFIDVSDTAEAAALPDVIDVTEIEEVKDVEDIAEPIEVEAVEIKENQKAKAKPKTTAKKKAEPKEDAPIIEDVPPPPEPPEESAQQNFIAHMSDVFPF